MKSQYLTTSEMQALERHAVEKYSISLKQMMRNAGKAVFDVVMNEILPTITGGDNDPCRPLTVIGKGNNGGDALVTARLLHEKGIDVEVMCIYPISDMSPMAKTEMMKCKKLGIKFVGKFACPACPDCSRGERSRGNNKYSLIIDGIFGFSLKGNPRLPEAKIIEHLSTIAQDDNHIPILSVDVPSGLDAHSGSIGQPTIKADYTVSLGMLKKGFEEHPEIIGKLYLGNLGIPDNAYRDMGYEAPMFREKSYISVN